MDIGSDLSSRDSVDIDPYFEEPDPEPNRDIENLSFSSFKSSRDSIEKVDRFGALVLDMLVDKRQVEHPYLAETENPARYSLKPLNNWRPHLSFLLLPYSILYH